ncbi:MAG: OmpA family protein [Archangium sp.]|nr:OmpA family protein [Archangium sp.]MDP3572168.1 OmpA family protein [Archangium sp.]
MFKQSLITVTLVVFSFGCAHQAAPRKLTAASVTAVRLDEVVRTKCKTVSAVTPVFDFSSSELSAEAKTTLDTVATCFTTGPLKDNNLRLIGFTDPTGTRADNYELGMDRAQSVALFLEKNGMKKAQLIVTSRGEEGASPDSARWPADRIVDLSLAN